MNTADHTTCILLGEQLYKHSYSNPSIHRENTCIQRAGLGTEIVWTGIDNETGVYPGMSKRVNAGKSILARSKLLVLQ